MKIAHVLLLTFLLNGASSAQKKLDGKTETKGTCSPATSGNQNIFIIKCGIDPERGKKMLDILNKILSSQLDTSAVMGKLDEILASSKSPQQQSNSGGINIQQGTTGFNSPIVDSPITVGEFPKRIAPADMPKLIRFLSTADTKANIVVTADQRSGAVPLPDDFYQILKDAGWSMVEEGVHPYMGFSAPGKTFQGAVIITHGEPVVDGATTRVGPPDPLFYIGSALKALNVATILKRSIDQPEGKITIDFQGGFPH